MCSGVYDILAVSRYKWRTLLSSFLSFLCQIPVLRESWSVSSLEAGARDRGHSDSLLSVTQLILTRVQVRQDGPRSWHPGGYDRCLRGHWQTGRGRPQDRWGSQLQKGELFVFEKFMSSFTHHNFLVWIQKLRYLIKKVAWVLWGNQLGVEHFLISSVASFLASPSSAQARPLSMVSRSALSPSSRSTEMRNTSSGLTSGMLIQVVLSRS